MALDAEDSETTTRTTLEHPSWGKPAAVGWPVPEACHRSFFHTGADTSLLPNLQETMWQAKKGLLQMPTGVTIAVPQTLIDFDLDRGRYPNRQPVPLWEKLDITYGDVCELWARDIIQVLDNMRGA